MAIQAVAMSPAIGSIVHGLDLSKDMSDGTMRDLIELLFERGVIVLPRQMLSDADYVRFAGFFGRPLEFFIPEHRNADHPEIIHINNDPATPLSVRDGAVHWHSDSSYEAEPGAVTMLFGKEAPDAGGETHFASTTAAYDSLPEEMKRRIDGLVAIHELGRAPWIEGETQPDPNRPVRKTDAPDHPLIMTHPVTGRKGIFTSGTAYAIHGMDDAEATALIRQLREHIVRPEHRISYKVQAGDIVLWDNFGTVHCATPIEYSDEDGKRRLLHRISTKGMPAFSGMAA
ncbi:TauD/TfdA family dioxygenase [Sphingobium sp.]|uniref:TauD/TfdA dioxygenase family protein n=1 Tax=Sphingobium sp. TaxID=1912891 RepID=UPI0028BF2362|nr:TauD/TfdA family dioxygenase [Sphingobium sp.]